MLCIPGNVADKNHVCYDGAVFIDQLQNIFKQYLWSDVTNTRKSGFQLMLPNWYEEISSGTPIHQLIERFDDVAIQQRVIFGANERKSASETVYQVIDWVPNVDNYCRSY